MSKSADEASEREPEEPENDSVFDFLYHDARRVGSFLAQLDEAGHLQQITQADSVAKGAKRGWKASLGGGAAGVASAEMSYERGPAEMGSETSERIYDPLWTNARTLLDYLAERDLIVRDIESARIGQFVLVSGELEISNLAMLQKAWDDEIIKRLIESGAEDDEAPLNRQQRRAMGRNTAPQEPSGVQTALALLKLMPHSLQARVRGDADVWCNLLATDLVVSPDDLVLKHGLKVQGDWTTLGILDAFPDENPVAEDEDPEIDFAAGSLIAAMMSVLGPATRTLLGRPYDAYGLTPLLIFREVAAAG